MWSPVSVVRAAIDEVGGHGGVEQLGGQLHGQLVEPGDVDELAEQVARVGGAEAAVGLPVVLVDQVVQHLAPVFEPHLAAVVDEDLPELLFGRVADFHLVADAAQEGLLDQILGRQVGGEDDQQIEGHLHLHAAGQVVVVVVLLERHYPAVEELPGGHLLATEVVDHEHAAVGLELQRSDVMAALDVPGHLEVLHQQLAADDDERPADEGPAAIERHAGGVGGVADGLVVDGVVELHHLPAGLDGVGDEDPAAERFAHPLGHQGLAVARMAVEEQRLAGVEGRPELEQHVLGHHQPLERLAHALHVELLPLGKLLGGGGDEAVERDGGDAGVAVAAHQVARVGGAAVGDAELPVELADRFAAPDAGQHLALQLGQHVLHHAGVGEPQGVADLAPGEVAAEQQQLGRQLHQERRAEPGLVDVGRRGRQRGQRFRHRPPVRQEGLPRGFEVFPEAHGFP
ncbi:MAG: hypothetical protein HYU66_01015 [Armatimonadetes bacterium]|nr:hypothetical protein [Armatimonadota bacterium]